MPKFLSLAWETILEIELAFEDKHCQPKDILELFRRLPNDVQNIHEELAVYINTPSWDCPTICYDDDDDEDYTIVVTPSLSTEDFLFSHIQLLLNIFYPSGMKIPFLIPASVVIISLLLCQIYLIGVELS
uniref:Uncharacterized protein n=1 Tax=Tanacetum cinerariifolium TaxID=118510 RepID=A0A699RDR0_TANCI|nr:hypothetical protein [Tanacetum cinerariifolium]